MEVLFLTNDNPSSEEHVRFGEESLKHSLFLSDQPPQFTV